MPRSLRHKSSKRSSREGRDYSDSEKDSSLKERKAKEQSASHRVSRESALGDKRKYDSKLVDGKDLAGAAKVDFVEEYGGSSSKKRKGKVDDDRWTGGDTDERESLKAEKDLKVIRDSKSRSRRGDESSGLTIDVDKGKMSGIKVDSRHHRSERKERSEKDGGLERDRRGKEYSTSGRFVDGEAGTDIAGGEGRKQVGVLEDRAGKHISSNSGAYSLHVRRNPDHEREPERRFRRKDSFNDTVKYLDGREVDDRRLLSGDEIAKPGKCRNDGHEDDTHRDKYVEDVENDSWFQDEKQQHRDGHHAKDYVNSRSDEKKDLDIQLKKLKHHENEHDHGRSQYIRHHDDRDVDVRNRDSDRDRDRDHDDGCDPDRDRGRDHDRDRGRDYDRDRDRERERERYRCEREREHDRGRGRDCDFSHEHSKEWDHDHDRDYMYHLDDRSSRYKEDRSRRRSPDDYDDYCNDKGRSVKAVVHADREKSVSRRSHSEAVAGSTRGRTSPGFNSLIDMDKYRDNKHDDFRYEESRDLPATPDKSSKYLSSDKGAKLDDNHVRYPSVERSPRMKISPTRLLEKSPSSTSIDRKDAKISGRRRSLDVDEAERRSSGSNDVRDGFIDDDRESKDLSSRKSMREEHSPVESSFHHKSSQGNGPFLSHGPTSYKAGADTPSLMGSMREDSRGHSSCYRRSVDPDLGRMHGNLWKGVPNWPTPLQTGFMPFPPGAHGPPHGGFPSILPQFPSPSIFGVGSPMEMNHYGIPYHLPDADRFAHHIRPLGWQNVVDRTGPSHFHGWNGNNGIFREESPIYGPGSMSNGGVRETNADVWKPNGDVKLETGTKGDGHKTKNFTDEACVALGTQGSHKDSSQLEDQGKTVPRKSPSGTLIEQALLSMAKGTVEKAAESPAVNDGGNCLRAYLSELDISMDLTNPELYNEVLTVGVIKLSENVAEMEDVKIAKTVGFGIASTTMGGSHFPAAQDSIFQRAIDLYKTHSINRRSFCMFDGDESNSPASGTKLIEQAQGREDEQVLEKEMEEPVCYQEIQGQPAKELSSATGQNEQMETKAVPISGNNEVPDPSLHCEMEIKETIGIENISPPKWSSDDALNSNTDGAEMRTAEDDEPAPCVTEQLGSEIGDPLNLPHGSVKVCEGLMPVSNVSESVTLTWVNHAPESTH